MTREDAAGLHVPDEGLQFTPPMRAHHLTGGLSLLIASNRLAMLMPSEQGMVFFSLSQDASVPSLLQEQEGLRHLGSNYFSSAAEMTEPVTKDFAISVCAQNGWCLAAAQSIEWHGVASALHQSTHGTHALVATRIASQVRACLARLERLSLAYRTGLLEARKRQAEPLPNKFTLNKYAAYIGIEYRATLKNYTPCEMLSWLEHIAFGFSATTHSQ
ncbi:hypothetical protein [Bradyrhizobium sp.]|uniref:hypothetical protein n=1 Tax=Bradyrhizobium sp. TaxID=376 RepID=UPI001ECF3008|nr:hypothetical protein [Bradyrhizobium sp.]MBV9484409.1 hypothetical protein [Acidobacteriota bacterium]MBV9984577.1 hypothetical protein [Bradyrhizobium sp.]